MQHRVTLGEDGRRLLFAAVPYAVMDDPRVDAMAGWLYTVLRRFADFHQETGAHVSHTRLAEVSGMSRRSVRRKLAELRDAGWVEWTGERGANALDYVVHFEPKTGSQPGGGPVRPTPPATVAHPIDTESHIPKEKERAPRARTPETPKAKKATWLTPYLAVWERVLGSTPAAGKAANYLGPLRQKYGDGKVIQRLEWYLSELERDGDLRFASLVVFSEKFLAWKKPGEGRPTQNMDKDWGKGLHD